MLDVSKSSISNNIPRIKEIILKLNQGYDTKSNFERVKEIRELLKVAQSVVQSLEFVVQF